MRSSFFLLVGAGEGVGNFQCPQVGSIACPLTLIRRTAAQVGMFLRPHDLRRYAATFASRSGVPLEIVSKVLLRHKSLRTTQVYLGRVMDAAALRWMDILYG